MLTEEILSKRLKIDIEIHFNQLNRELFNKLQKFEPTGLGNPSPVFVTRSVDVLNARAVGKDANHLKLKVRESGTVFNGDSFQQGEILY